MYSNCYPFAGWNIKTGLTRVQITTCLFEVNIKHRQVCVPQVQSKENEEERPCLSKYWRNRGYYMAVWGYYFYLSRVKILVSPWLLTLTILTFWNRKYKYYCLFLLFNFISEFHNIFCDRHFAMGDHFNCTILLFRKWIKTVVFYVGISSVSIK